MANFSRRQLARYAVDQLLAKQAPAEVAKHLAAALSENKMQHQTELLLDDIAEELEDRGLMAKAIITSRSKLPANLLARLADQIKKATGVQKVSVQEQIDEQVIGGFKVETAKRTWDKTIAHHLAEIKGGI